MNRNYLLEEMKEVFSNAIKIVDKKNRDYATNSDPFLNFKGSEQVGVSVPRGILVRIMDKITRVGNLLNKEASVKDEAIEDTLLDLCNYCAILLVYLKDAKSSLKDCKANVKLPDIGTFLEHNNE